MCEADYLAYHQLAHRPHHRSLLTTTLVLPALVEAVHRLKDPAEHEGDKWAEIIRRRMEEEQMDGEPIEVAQKLFGDPVRRAFESARAAIETIGGEE